MLDSLSHRCDDEIVSVDGDVNNDAESECREYVTNNGTTAEQGENSGMLCICFYLIDRKFLGIICRKEVYAVNAATAE